MSETKLREALLRLADFVDKELMPRYCELVDATVGGPSVLESAVFGLLEESRAIAALPAETPAPPPDSDGVPGMWMCPTCEFQLTKNWISPDLMKVAPNKNDDAELCPNDGARMVPLSWKSACENQEKYIADLHARLDALAAAHSPSVPPTKEESCGTAQVAITSTSEGTLPTANRVSLSGELLSEWDLLSQESQEKVEKWFDLAVEHLQGILDGASPSVPAATSMREPGLCCNHCNHTYPGLKGPCPKCGKNTAQKLITYAAPSVEQPTPAQEDVS